MMERVGYDLTPVAIPDGVLHDAMSAAQKVMDDQYLRGPGGLDNFYGQADGWLQTQALIRRSNRAYVPDPFPMAIPHRLAVVINEGGLSFSVQAMPPDPRIKMPALDPLPPDAPPPPSGPFGPAGGLTGPPSTVEVIVEENNRMLKAITAYFHIA